ncbi:MAG: trigger factor [Candidatus Aminicenantes bacterium]|nr:trigger factor [Candidatus Aminicenantes bacterium]
MEQNTNQDRLKILSPTLRTMDLEISAEEVKKEYEKVLKKYIARVKLPGFRQGHAPREMVEKMFQGEIREDILDTLIPENLRQELETLNVYPVSVPRVKSIDFDLEKGVKYQVEFEVWPEFNLPNDYLGEKIKLEEIKIEESEIETILKNIQENAAEYLPVNDRGVVDGDYVVIEIQGKDLAEKKFLPVEKIVVLAGHAENEPQLNASLTGMKPGEEKTFTVSYPEDYKQKRFAGRQLEYRVKVLEIKEKKLPELNDEFAKTVDEVDSLEALKEKIRQDLIKHREAEKRSQIIDEFLSRLAEKINLTIPESMVKEEAEAIIARQFREEELKKIPREVWPQVAAQARSQAEKNLKHHLLMREIARKEGLAVSDAELDEEIKKIAEERNVPVDKLKEALVREERLEDWRLNLLLRKTIDFLEDKIIIK